VIVVVPSDRPATTPEAFTLPTVGVLLLQAPPVTVLANVVVRPWHTVPPPVIGAGMAIIVATVVDLQPDGNA
jgi:hypothetical protein